MKNINEKVVELKFNPKLYTKECVLEAIGDFKKVCSCSLNESGGYIIVTLNVKSGNPGEIGHELCNYVLGLMKNKAEV